LKNWRGDWSGQITNCRSPYLLEMAEKKAKSKGGAHALRLVQARGLLRGGRSPCRPV